MPLLAIDGWGSDDVPSMDARAYLLHRLAEPIQPFEYGQRQVCGQIRKIGLSHMIFVIGGLCSI